MGSPTSPPGTDAPQPVSSLDEPALEPRFARWWNRLRHPRWNRWGPALLLAAGVLGGATWFWCSLPEVDWLKTTNPRTTALIEIRQQQGLLPRRSEPLTRAWVPLSRIPPLVQRTFVLAEDAGFWGHEGVDWTEVGDALKQALKHRSAPRGASTISQQLVKNLFLSPERSLWRKLEEWMLVGRLERSLTKRRILELYVNCVEFGPGIFGIGAASRTFFGKEPSELRLDEVARLAAILPRPLRLSPVQPSNELVRRARIVLERLRQAGTIDEEQLQAALEALQPLYPESATESP